MSGWRDFMRCIALASFIAARVKMPDYSAFWSHLLAHSLHVAFFALSWWVCGKVGRWLDGELAPTPERKDQ